MNVGSGPPATLWQWLVSRTTQRVHVPADLSSISRHSSSSRCSPNSSSASVPRTFSDRFARYRRFTDSNCGGTGAKCAPASPPKNSTGFASQGSPSCAFS